MSFQANVPPSVLAKLARSAEADADAATPEDKIRKREDWKKLKELEEARKAGTAPAMQDEEGKDINPHIPQYIMQAPWYFGADAPTLRHQRQQEEKLKETTPMERWYKRGIKEGPIATKFRKGACENCGAMTHKKRDCLERPRKLGAKFTGTNIAPDEHVQQQLEFDYDSKRDRWNGFDTDEYTEVIQKEYAKLEEAKRLLKTQQLETDIVPEDDNEGAVKKGGDDSGGEDDEDKYADHVDMPGQKFESKQRITVRNLRIREDTAKYLYNLDLNSAHYDPKTRSMRQNPFDIRASASDKFMTYQGDNFVRYSGDAMQMANKQIFAWEAYEKGADIHLQADPTQLELLTREYKQKKDTYKETTKQSILDKYGGEEHLEALPKELLLAQSENYVEYSRHGTVIKGAEKAKMKSIYEEDVYLNNHRTVWGSYWKDGQWGFKCCHSVVKESYCTGAAGQAASEENASVQRISAPQLLPKSAEKPKVAAPSTSAHATSAKLEVAEQSVSKEPVPARFKFFASAPAPVKEEKESKTKSSKKKRKRDKRKKKRREKKRKKKKQVSSSSSDDSSSDPSSSSSSSESEDEDAAREKRIKEAMLKEDKRVREVNKIMKLDERKRPYNSMYNEAAPNEDDLEAFKRKRIHPDDPMAAFLK